MRHHPRLKNHWQEKQILTQRLKIAITLMIVLLILLVTRLVFLQIMDHNKYTTLSKNNRIDIHPIEPTRGLIYDRNGFILAKNNPVFSLDLIPNNIAHLSAQIKALKKIIPISDEELANFNTRRHQSRRFASVTLKLKLNPQQVARFSVNRYRFPGMFIQTHLIRSYPSKESSAHVLGYVGQINQREIKTIDPINYQATHTIGKVGIEKFYESTLHGKIGYQRVEIDASGKVIRNLTLTPPQPGENIYLSIDHRLQDIATQALRGHQGAIVAIDPNNGEILAMVSMPSYDPNLFIQGISQKHYHTLASNPNKPLYNRVLRGLYPPASTIKPFLGFGGLDSKTIQAKQSINDPGYYQLPHSQHIFHDWKRNGHGKVDLHQALIVSCDTYFYWLAHRMGIKKIDQSLDYFGFGKHTGIDMGEELSGVVPSPSWKVKHQGATWYPGDTLITGIGQGYTLVTPIQLAQATAILAMHGKRVQPHLLLATQKPQQSFAFHHAQQRQATPSSATPETWEVIIDAMQDVISDPHGTGFRFGHPSAYTVAAKTGTAQVYSLHGHASSNNTPTQLKDNGLFIAFAPVRHPKIVVAVIVEHSTTVAPIAARQMIDAYLLPQKKEPSHHVTTT